MPTTELAVREVRHMSGERQAQPDDHAGLKAYWVGQGMRWRTEPEIDAERQTYLAKRRAVQPDIEKGVYPFRDENGPIKLTRADIEWLLATHDDHSGLVGPVDWGDKRQREREGLDLRGADLRGVDLRALPLARTRGSLTNDELPEGASDTDIATLSRAVVHLEGAKLNRAHMERMQLRSVRLDGADLRGAFLDRASLYGAHLNGVNFSGASLAGVSFRRAIFDDATNLYAATLSSPEFGGINVRDARWGGVVLSVVDWTRTRPGLLRTRIEAIELGDDRLARERMYAVVTDKGVEQKPKTSEAWLRGDKNAVRANRQLATVLHAQGLNEDADRFAYRAQKLQRQVLRRQGRWGASLGSWLLDILAGYGYKPMRAFIAYLVVICLFAGAYLLNAQFAAPHLTWDESLVLSISSFHGRGFFTSGVSLGDTLARLAAGEAIIGLLIEITFIATFTQRFFAR
jgi:uncharacterized protein YjbI with pentapeptide repeats